MLGTTVSYETFGGNSADGDGRHVAVNVGGVRIAGAVYLRQRYDAADPTRMSWHLVPVLRLPGVDGDALRTVEVRDEAHALAWLAFLAGMYSASAVGVEDDVRADVEPPAEVLTEADFAEDEEVSVAELDDDEQAYWDEVWDCCGGRSYWCSHFRQYPPAVVAAGDGW